MNKLTVKDMNNKIKCNKDLFNGGQCFTKGKEYTTTNELRSKNKSALIDASVVENDLGGRHNLGNWWVHFKVL